MIILKLVIILIGLLLIGYFYPKSRKKIDEMNALKSKTIEELKSVFEAAGNESYRELVELKGRTTGENLVTAPYSKKNVVYYEYDVYAVEEDIDNSGNRRESERHMESDRYRGNIQVGDDSTNESIIVDINQNCNLNIPVTYNKFEPKGGVLSSIGGVNISLGNFNRSGVIGYKIKEKTIDQGQDLYIIGEAYKEENRIHIGKPTDRKKSFIVTTKSEEDMIKSLKTTSIFQIIAGIALVVIGVFLLTTNII